ncbi:MAG: MFS transporter [Nocardiopsaceae bacterium]|nr:MFS transporter [Nocardiopsaceae bacterium]
MTVQSEVATAPAHHRRPLGPHYKWVALSNTTLGVLMATINQSIVLISLPAIFKGINLNPLEPGNTSYLLWMFMGFMVVSAVLVVSFGRLGDMFGRVKMYNMGFAVFSVGSIALAATYFHGTNGALWLIGWRIVQGIGGAFLFANSTAILTDAFPISQRGTALGLNSIAAIAGSFIGLILGGVLAPINWHWVFLVSVPFGVFGTIWAYFMLHDIGTRKHSQMDWWGNLLFGVGLIVILIGITYGLMPYGGHAMGWTNPWVIAGLAGGVVLLILFVWVETKVPEPLFRMSLFKIRPFAAGNVSQLMLALSRGGMQFMLIIWLQGIWLPLHGYSYKDTPLWAGIYLVPLTIGFLLSAPLSGVLSDKLGAKAFTIGGSLVAGATFLVLVFLPVNFTYWQFAVIVGVNGFGMGLFVSPNRAEMMNAVPADARGAAGGMIATFMNAASVLSIGIFFSLMVGGLASKLPTTMFSGLTAQGVPAAAAGPISHLPPIGVLFSAFLGYNPMKETLGKLLAHMNPAHAAYLTGRKFFPHLITTPFHSGLGEAFAFAIAACVIAAIASALTGRARSPRTVESAGAKLAATASENVGYEPAELVVPVAEEVTAVDAFSPIGSGTGQREFAMAGAPPWETIPQDAVGAESARSSAGMMSAPVAMTNGLGLDGPAVFGHVRRGDDSPLPGATVTLIDLAGRQAGIGHSGLDGRYQVPVPGRGTYTIIAMASAHEPFASAVRVADRPAEVDVRLSGASRLRGVIRAAGSGLPLAGVTATLASARGEVVGTTVTGEDGWYTIENLVAGRYTLALAAPSCQPAALPVTVIDGQEARLDAELGSGARVAGTARNASGAAVPDARITLLDAEGNVAGVAVTGQDGGYSFENLPGGEYTVIAAGYPPAASRLKVAGSDPHSHDVELRHPES